MHLPRQTNMDITLPLAGGGKRQDPHLFDSTVQIQICDNNLIECMKTETEEAQKEDLPSVTYMNISLSHQRPDAF